MIGDRGFCYDALRCGRGARYPARRFRSSVDEPGAPTGEDFLPFSRGFSARFSDFRIELTSGDCYRGLAGMLQVLTARFIECRWLGLPVPIVSRD